MADDVSTIKLGDVIDYGKANNASPVDVATAVRKWRDTQAGWLKDQKPDDSTYFKGLEYLDNESGTALKELQKQAVTEWGATKLPSIIPDPAHREWFREQMQKAPPSPDELSLWRVPEGADPEQFTAAYRDYSKLATGKEFQPSRLSGWQTLNSGSGAELAKWRAFETPKGTEIQVQMPGEGDHHILLPEISDEDYDKELQKAKKERVKLSQEESSSRQMDVTDPVTAAVTGMRQLPVIERASNDAADKVRILEEDPERGKVMISQERLTEALKNSPLADKIGKKDLLQDFNTGLWSGLSQIRIAANDIMGDTAKRDALRAELADYQKKFPGSTRREFQGGFGDILRQGVQGLGSAIPTVAAATAVGAATGGEGIPAGIQLAGRALSMAPLAAQSYGGNLDAMLSDADNEEKKGNMELAKSLRENARTAATLSAITDVGTEMIFPEERLAGKGIHAGSMGSRIVKETAKSAGQNFTEEALAQAIQGNVIQPTLQGKQGTAGDILEAGAAGIVAGAPLGAVSAIINRPNKEATPPNTEIAFDALDKVSPAPVATALESKAPPLEPVEPTPAEHAGHVAEALAENPDTSITASALAEIAGEAPKEGKAEAPKVEEVPPVEEHATTPPNEEVQNAPVEAQGVEEVSGQEAPVNEPAVIEKKPVLVSANNNDGEISLEFDASHPAPSKAELESMFSTPEHKAVVTQFAGNIISTARGTARYKVEFYDKNGALRSAPAKAAYEKAFGTSKKIRGESRLMQAGSLKDRYTAAYQAATEAPDEYLSQPNPNEGSVSEPSAQKSPGESTSLTGTTSPAEPVPTGAPTESMMETPPLSENVNTGNHRPSREQVRSVTREAGELKLKKKGEPINPAKTFQSDGMMRVASLVSSGATIAEAISIAKAGARESIELYNSTHSQTISADAANGMIERAGELLAAPQSKSLTQKPLTAPTGAPIVAPKTVADFKKGDPVTVARSAIKTRNGQAGEVISVSKGSQKVNVKMPDGKILPVSPEALDKPEISSTPAAPQAVTKPPTPKEVDETEFVWTPSEDDDDPTDAQGAAIAGATGGAVLHPSSPSAPVKSVKAISQIIRDLSKGIGLPIRFGRLTTSRFAGYYKKVQNLIGAKKANDIPVVAHEIGHKLDDSFDISSNPAIAKELNVLGDPATPGSKSSWTKSKNRKYKMGEGVGEFVRYWLTDPKKAASMAPDTKVYFESILDANPDFGAVMNQAQEDIQNWINAPAEARLDSSISVGSSPNKARYRLMELTRDLLDDLHVFQAVAEDAEAKSGKPLKPSEDFYKNSRLLRGSYGMAQTFIQRGVVDFKTRQVKLGTSLEDALKPVAGNLNAFRRWIVAKRAQELHKQGRETGLVRADVDAVANAHNGDKVFQKTFDDLKAWNDALLQYGVDAGYVSQESADAMRKMNEDYVPFHRVFEIGAGEDPAQDSSGTGRGLNAGKVSSLKRLTGSTRDIVDPIESMMKNAYAIITASEKSNIANQIADLSEKPGMGKWVEKIATPQEAVKTQAEFVRKQLEKAGADMTAVPDDLPLTFFRPSGHAPFGENIIKVTKNGKTTFYRLNSELFKAFHGLDMADSDKLIQIFSSPAQVLRAGVTLDPAFGGANIIRDAFGSAVINRYGLLPFQATIKGIAAMLKNPKLVAEWAASGGENSFEASFFDRKAHAKYVRERITKDLTPTQRAGIWLKSPLRALRWLSGMSEAATRIGEYKTAFDAGMKSGLSEGDARRQAAFESRDRQDFAMGGAKTKILRHAAAFWNAGLQSNAAIYRAFKDRPLRTTLQGLAYITLPTLGLLAINHNDEDYWDQPQWLRDNFWCIPYGKDENGHTKFLKLPKPFILGTIFGALPERIMAANRGNKEAWRELASRFAENIPNPIPNTALMFLEPNITDQGYSLWRGRTIVPDALKDLPPEYQVTEQSSLTAKRIGKLLGISPMKVDYFLASSTGGVGKQVVYNGIDRVISAMTGEERTAENTGPISRFFTAPAGISSQAVDLFYRDLEALKKKKGGEKLGGEEMTGEERGKLVRMERLSDVISKIRKQAHSERDPAEKQRLYLRISEMARDAED